MESPTEHLVGVRKAVGAALYEEKAASAARVARSARSTASAGREWVPVGVWAADAAALIPPGLPRDPTRELSARRALNVLTAAVGLVVAAPLMLVIAILVKLTSRGPVFYTQPRVGVDRRHPLSGAENGRRGTDAGGRVFRIYKFRTMYVGSDNGGQVWATPDDPRITPLGRILRRTRMDEIPQLLNVLLGDMNVVGPRPEQPAIFQRLREEVPGYDLRQRVRPGITGLAQITHPYDRDVEDVRRKLRLDLEYIRRSSARHDLRIMLRTVPVLMARSYGW